MLDFDIKHENADQISARDALKNEEMVDALNYLESEGFIELEEDSEGIVRAYPAG